MFGKSTDTACSVDELIWYDENNNRQKLNCFFETGQYKGKSKGLFVMAKELNIIEQNVLPKHIKLEKLRELAAKHPAFKRKSKLENLVDELNIKYKMNVRLIHAQKFHVELNPIEMYWAILKNNFRKINDQSNNSALFLERIIQCRLNYMKNDVNHKLWSRFWRIIVDYQHQKTYREIMRHYFNSSDVIKSHRKVYIKK
jgi:hypothetical protein